MGNRKKLDDGGNFNDYPNPKWAQFFEKFSEIETLPVSQWKPVHLLSYFCKKYENHYQVKYQFKFNSPKPTSSFEVFQVKRLALLLSADPEVLKPYIDWVFKVKVEGGKRRLTSISFMTHESLINDYKVNVLLSNKTPITFDRSSPLPENIKTLLSPLGAINTYGNFAFLYQSFKAGALDQELSDKFKLVLNSIQQIKFDITVLDRII